MARTSRNGAPAANFDDIDNIDIDDMFADDGDALFAELDDGLGIDLDQMGDITNLGTEGDVALDIKSEEKSAPKPSPAHAAEEPPKRRKTKRKPKSPILLDEEEELNEAPRKKRRSTKTVTTKKKGSKKEKEEPKIETSKTKSKVKGMGMPPPLARHPSSGPSTPSQGNVAAAGQFGGRQKRGGFALPLRPTSDKQKTKSTKSSAKASVGESAAAASSATATVVAATSTAPPEKSKLKKSSTPPAPPPSAPEPPKPKPPPVFTPPAPQSTFCGLNQSNTLFYPFMPGLPAEPSIKNRKQYPVVDKIHMSFMGHINATSTSAKNMNGGGTAVAETENIYRLMHDTLKDLNPSGGQANATVSPQDDKRTAISSGIGSSRQAVASLEKPKLAAELFSVCSLLKRQYDFLQQNLSNMELWCKENFSEADYNATYGSPENLKKQKEPPVESVLSQFKKPLIKVKVRCNGFKEPKLSGPLFALLPQKAVEGTAAVSTDHTKEKKAPKKRKSSMSEPSLVASVIAPAVVEKEVVIKTYPELRPAKRRQAIMEHIAHTAKELEAACISRTAARCQAIERRHLELKKMVEEDEVLVIHTAAMWQYIDKAGYFAEFTEDAIRDTLRSVWAPEIKHEILSTVKEKNGRLESTDKAVQGMSVFEGLQSLLVEVSSDDEDEDGCDNDDGDSFLHNNIDEPIQTLDAAALPSGLVLADLSSLSIDERAFLHLRRAGLLDNHELPATLSDPSNVFHIDSSRGRKDADESGTRKDGGTLEGIIDRMSTDLRELNKVNNARASFLESVARAWLTTTNNAKKKADEESAMIAKCQQILKRSKDNKVKAAKPKIATKDEYALPW